MQLSQVLWVLRCPLLQRGLPEDWVEEAQGGVQGDQVQVQEGGEAGGNLRQ